MGKPRKVALITGITGQVSAGRGRAACGLGARGPRPPRRAAEARGTALGASRKVCAAAGVSRLQPGQRGSLLALVVSSCCAQDHSVLPVLWVTVAFLPRSPKEGLEGISYFAELGAGKEEPV